MTDAPQTPPPTGGPETHAPEESIQTPHIVQPSGKKSVREIQSIRNLWIVIGGLAVLLIISILMRQSPERATVAADDPELAAMRADLEVRRAELNRQRAELDLPPLVGHGEAVEEITARLRRDADTLVSLAERYQQLLADKDRKLAEKNIELIRSEQQRESLTAEVAGARNPAPAPPDLRNDLAEALARSNRLADELSAAREQIAQLSANPPTDEIETLTRRLDEANRARDFFEQRASELEALMENEDDALPGEE